MIIQVWGSYSWSRSRHTEDEHETQAAKEIQEMLRHEHGNIMLLDVKPEELTFYAEVETTRFTPSLWEDHGMRVMRKDTHVPIAGMEKYAQHVELGGEPWNVRAMREREERQQQDAHPSGYYRDTSGLDAMTERVKRAREAKKSPEERQTAGDEWYKERAAAIAAMRERMRQGRT